MKEITLDLSHLKKMIETMEKDNMDFVRLRIIKSFVDTETIYPAFLHIDGISQKGIYRDYESLDETSCISAI